MRMKKIYLFLGISMAVAALIAAALFILYLLLTTKGSNSIIKSALSKYIPSERIDFRSVNGNLARTLSYEDIIFEGLNSLPDGSILKIQKLDISLTSLGLAGLNVSIDNGTLRMPNFNTILFYGVFQGGRFDINVYSKSVGIREALDLFTHEDDFKKISGTMSDLDAYIKGTLLEPELTGVFRIDELSHNGFLMTDCSGSFNLLLKDIRGGFKLFGPVSLNGGVVSGPRTAVVNIEESKIIFSGEPKKPSLALNGTSNVEGTEINIVLKGSFEKPELKLSSDPPRSQERLLIMLATGKSWKTAEGALGQGKLSVDLTKDFLDYFLFSGMGSKLAQHLGISDLSATFEKDKKGVSVKKAVSDKIEASYAVEQSQEKEAGVVVTQRIGGEYKVTDSIAVGVEKEIKENNRTDQSQEKEKANDKVILKFKKKF